MKNHTSLSKVVLIYYYTSICWQMQEAILIHGLSKEIKVIEMTNAVKSEAIDRERENIYKFC